jgi:hypothetical protein
MSQIRSVKQTWISQPTMEGAGVRLRRAFGSSRQAALFDPFLLLDDFRADDPADYAPGFPWHLHRGIETITYVLRGQVEHGDSLGNRGVIAAGDVQWMTAGSGIVHQEMPKGDEGGRMGGFQLWANLPAADKMMAPRYRGVTSAEIPEALVPGGARVKVICGRVGETRGPVQDIVTDPEYLDVTLPPGAAFAHPVPDGYTAFTYVIEGGAQLAPGAALAGDGTLALFGERGELAITAGPQGARLLLVSGRPIREPIAWYGPIVMNTDGEVRRAFDEYERGTFLKHKKT